MKWMRQIDVSKEGVITIGGDETCHIVVRSKEWQGKSMRLTYHQGNIWIYPNGLEEIRINTRPIVQPQITNRYDFIMCHDVTVVVFKESIQLVITKPVSCQDGLGDIGYRQATRHRYPFFYRQIRLKKQVHEQVIQMNDPPEMKQTDSKRWVMTLLPLVLMISLFVLMRQHSSNQSSFMGYSLLMMGVSAVGVIIQASVTIIVNYKEKRKNRQKYLRHLEDIDKQMMIAQCHERDSLCYMCPSPHDNAREILEFGRRLFERLPEDDDFLSVTLGYGKRNSCIKLDMASRQGDSGELLDRARDMIQQYLLLETVPITVSLYRQGNIGVIGDRDYRLAFMSNIILEIVTRHADDVVSLIVIATKQTLEAISWVRWLQHIWHNTLEVRQLVYDASSQKSILDNLYQNFLLRRAKASRSLKAIIVIVYDMSLFRNHPLSHHVKESSKLGMTFVFCDTVEENIPPSCHFLIQMLSETDGYMIETESGQSTSFQYESLSTEQLETLASRLGGIQLPAVTTKHLDNLVSLESVLGDLSALDIFYQWEKRATWSTLSVPIGLLANGDVFYLDISDTEEAHGPHGLIAGTTGSGKSDVIQTYIVSLACHYSPEQVTCLMIDFKGGGTAQYIQSLPHLVGVVTNMDADDIERTMQSLRAEILKRQKLFATYQVNHINAYRALIGVDGREILAHLIIIVDEFAELKTDYPEWMKELISIARIGRTLGVHLVLATQKPAGVIDAQIWSNMTFKICLKVQSKEDSQDVLKSPLAAEISQAGRGYFKVGHDQVFELFQAAYSQSLMTDRHTRERWTVDKIALNGKSQSIWQSSGITKKSGNQLEYLVKKIRELSDLKGYSNARQVCLPALPEQLIYEEELAIARYDLPRHQKQGVIVIDPLGYRICLIGDAQMGKSTAIKTLLQQAFEQEKETHVYIIDCDAKWSDLKMVQAIGDVILPIDEEKCYQLFRWLKMTLQERKSCHYHQSSQNSGVNAVAHIILVIENYSAFKDYFPNEVEALETLLKQGANYGISVVMTTRTAAAFSNRVLLQFETKIAFYCQDAAEYSQLFGYTHHHLPAIKGRALTVKDQHIVTCQFAKVENGLRCPKNWIAPAIQTVPAILHFPKSTQNGHHLPLGMVFETLDIDYLSPGFLAFIGSHERAKKYCDTLVCYYEALCPAIDYITDQTPQPLAAAVTALKQILQRQSTAQPYLLVIHHSSLIYDMAEQEEWSQLCVNTLKYAGKSNAMIILSGIDNDTVQYQDPPLIKFIKEKRQGILFDAIQHNQFFEMGYQTGRTVVEDSTIAYRFHQKKWYPLKLFTTNT